MDHFALQQSEAGNVRYGSKADIRGVEPMSAITPKATVKADMRTRAASELGGHLRQCGWLYSKEFDYVAIGDVADFAFATRARAARSIRAAP
jgi:hypothetical protein